MSRAQLFPRALILLNLGAAVLYAAEADRRRATYRTAAAVLTFATF